MFERVVGSGWGAVDLSSPSIAYELGSIVSGTVTVRAKRDLGPGHLSVALVCVQRDARTLPPVLSKRITRERSTTEIWRTTTDLDTDLHIAAGDQIEHPFELQLPKRDDADPNDGIPEWARGTIAVLNTVTFARSSMQWHLRAKFHHPDGFDLRRNRSVLVNP